MIELRRRKLKLKTLSTAAAVAGSATLLIVAPIPASAGSAGVRFTPHLGPCGLRLLETKPLGVVGVGQESKAVDEVISATAVLRQTQAACAGVVVFANQGGLKPFLSKGDVTTTELTRYRTALRSLVPQSTLESFIWETPNRVRFATTGIADRFGRLLFEPLSSSWPTSPDVATSRVLRATSSVERGVTTYTVKLIVTQNTHAGTLGYKSTETVSLQTKDRRHVLHHDELISFVTGPAWQAKAVEEPSVSKGSVSCVDVQATIDYAVSFKSLSAQGGSGGFSAVVTVSGSLGSNGQQQSEVQLCADGSVTTH